MVSLLVANLPGGEVTINRFEALLKLFSLPKCTAFVCNWLLCRHLRSGSTVESLVGCYVFFCFFFCMF